MLVNPFLIFLEELLELVLPVHCRSSSCTQLFHQFKKFMIASISCGFLYYYHYLHSYKDLRYLRLARKFGISPLKLFTDKSLEIYISIINYIWI